MDQSETMSAWYCKQETVSLMNHEVLETDELANRSEEFRCR